LIAFMFLLGILFENGRRAAHAKMEETLKELAEANKRLTQVNEDKSELLSIAAHDLKNPLTVVMGYSDRLAMGNMDAPNVTRIAKTISREASRMRDLITTVLDLSALEDGSKKIQMRPVNLPQVIELALEHFRSVAEQKGIALAFESSDILTEAYCDHQAVLQILDNLISNGIKFSKPGTRVSVLCGTLEQKAFLKVADQGPGISEEDQKQLFKKFTRLSARPTGGESSSGLGLSIVKRLLQSMAGEVKCESQVGRGTTFTVYLPASVQDVRAEWEVKPSDIVEVERSPVMVAG
jgi:signal transduction histidine kinase